MSQTDDSATSVQKIKIHKLTVRNKTPGRISTGMNTEVLLDGKKLSAKFLKIELKPNALAKVTLEIYADVEVDLDPKIN